MSFNPEANSKAIGIVLALGFSSQLLANQLVPGVGRDQVLQNCLGCHSESMITQNHKTKKAWDATIDLMQKKHNLWPLSPEIRGKILNYLSTHYAPKPQQTDLMDGLAPRRVNPLLCVLRHL